MSRAAAFVLAFCLSAMWWLFADLLVLAVRDRGLSMKWGYLSVACSLLLGVLAALRVGSIGDSET